ncbi:MAG TPA: PilZ domain-containing protein [Anaeromyxobacteraceae bacterium]|nr:PilZ domain-containing protein [Anaeromyxobacteraceae bacterium]
MRRLVHGDILDPRRAPRVPQRCQVEIRDRFSSWRAETEDLGPRGCQLVTPRLAAPGRELSLAIRCEPIGRTVRASGRVVWSRAVEPSRLGVELLPGHTDLGWFEQLVRADPSAARAAGRRPDRLPREATLFLGAAPRLVADFSAEEVALLKTIGEGRTVDAVARRLGSAFDRVRGALFSLLSRRLLVLSRDEAEGPERWAPLLEEAERSLAAEGIRLPARAPRESEPLPTRPPAAQALYDDGMGHLGAGRIEVAVARLREAQALAPGDPLIEGALRRLAPWASP